MARREPPPKAYFLNTTILFVFVPLLLFFTPQQFAVFVNAWELITII
jgi:hypothetical protein